MHTYKLVSNFKDRLVELCEKSPMSDTDISKALGVSKQTLSSWRCGTRSPKGPTIETLARFFHVTVDWLMGFDGPMDGEDKEKPITEDELFFLVDLSYRLVDQKSKRTNPKNNQDADF